MEICSKNHEEIAYEGGTCPFCEADELNEKQVDELQETIKDLNSEIQNLQGEQE
jgi:hypothetical protein